MTCKTCKHWYRGGEFVHAPEGRALNVCDDSRTGLCLHPSMGSDYVDDWMQRKPPQERTDGIYAGCDEGRGHVVMGEDFGCIHFQESLAR